MPRHLLRFAVLSAGLAVGPAVATLSRAADEPAKDESKDARPNQPGERPARPAEGRAGFDPAALVDRVENALKEVDLSALQRRSLAAAVAKARKAAGEQKPAAGGDPRERMEQVQAVLSDLRESITDALSADQKKALDEKLPILSRGARPAKSGGVDGRVGVMSRAADAALAKLDLSDEQKAKVRAVNEGLDKKTRELIEQAGGDREQVGRKIRPLLEERRDKMAEILTPEQMAKFQAEVREQMEKLRTKGGPAAGRPNAGRPGTEGPGAARRGGERPGTPVPGKKGEEK